MTRLSFILLAAVVLSALYLVQVQYDGRRLVTELDGAQAEAHRLEAEHERLQAEKRTGASSLRVEKLAQEKLGMRTVTPAITEYVTSPAAVAGPSRAASAASPAGGRP